MPPSRTTEAYVYIMMSSFHNIWHIDSDNRKKTLSLQPYTAKKQTNVCLTGQPPVKRQNSTEL